MPIAETAKDLKAIYNRHAMAYDSARLKNLFEKTWLDRFCADVPEGGSIVDLGCGAGQPIADYLIKRGFTVTGVDFAENMLAIAKQRYPEARWLEADLRDLNLGEKFDGVLAWNSLFHLSPDEQRASLPRILAHAKASAVFMTTSGPQAGEATGKVQGEAVYHGSLSEDEYRSILADHGFSLERFETDKDCNDHTILLATRKEQTQ